MSAFQSKSTTNGVKMKPELTSKLFVELKKKEISKVEPRKSSCHRGVLQQQQAVIYLWNKVSWIQQSDFITQKGKRHRSITFTLISIVHVIKKIRHLAKNLATHPRANTVYIQPRLEVTTRNTFCSVKLLTH